MSLTLFTLDSSEGSISKLPNNPHGCQFRSNSGVDSVRGMPVAWLNPQRQYLLGKAVKGACRKNPGWQPPSSNPC